MKQGGVAISAPSTSTSPGGNVAQLTFDWTKIFNRITKSLLIICFWAVWATQAQAASDVLFYNPRNGAATIGRIEADGQFYSLFNYPAGRFATDWSHIVRASNGLLFFYRQRDGFWAVGRPDANVGFVTLSIGYLDIYDLLAGSSFRDIFVVNTPNGIVIYRTGLLGLHPTNGIIGQVRSNGLFQVTDSHFYLGPMTNIVNTPNGVFFLRAHGGLVPSQFAVGRVLANGAFSQTHSGATSVTLDHEVVAIGDDLVFLPYARRFPDGRS